jgi:phosphoglucomutase
VSLSPRAGHPADPAILVNVPRLMTAYYTRRPDPAVTKERVTFGTSGHRGSAFDCAFNEAQILAITQAICGYRKYRQFDGPLFLGIETHALSASASAFASAFEVLAANGIEVMIDDGGPAGTDATRWIEDAANFLLTDELRHCYSGGIDCVACRVPSCCGGEAQ